MFVFFQLWPFWILFLTEAISGQVNIELRSKGDPPKSLQQKIQHAFISDKNSKEVANNDKDEYIVQFYPSQVCSTYRVLKVKCVF